MPNAENLVPCTPENAKERQLKSAAARSRNCARRRLFIDAFQSLMKKKVSISKSRLDELGELGEGIKEGSKIPQMMLSTMKILAKIEERGEGRSFVELLKAGGMHFDQSDEALGTEENPINYVEHNGKPTKEHLDEIARQAKALGVIDDGDSDDANSGND